MLFSRTAVHGIYALCYLNQAERGTLVSAPAVAAAFGIPRAHASKVLQSLNNAGLVRSIRGRRGGYMPIKQLNEISVVEVLDALNPPDDDERLRPKTCKRDSGQMCGAHRGLQRLNSRARDALADETLEGLSGTVCNDLDGFRGERLTELAGAAQGESGP
jgi:Rrf2 family protein